MQMKSKFKLSKTENNYSLAMVHHLVEQLICCKTNINVN